MIDKKYCILTLHDVNPSCSEELQKITDQLNELNIKYNISIVPDYRKKYNLKESPDFCNQIATVLHSDRVELTLHGLYHQIDGKIEDYDSESKEEEKNDIQKSLDILSSVKLPRPRTFIPPAWFLSRQAIEVLYDLDFDIAEARSALEFIKERKKYLASQVMNWDRQGDKEKNKQALKENKEEFYRHLFNIDGESYGLFRMAIHPAYDPDEALGDQLEMIKYLIENESYTFINYSDLVKMD